MAKIVNDNPSIPVFEKITVGREPAGAKEAPAAAESAASKPKAPARRRRPSKPRPAFQKGAAPQGSPQAAAPQKPQNGGPSGERKKTGERGGAHKAKAAAENPPVSAGLAAPASVSAAAQPPAGKTQRRGQHRGRSASRKAASPLKIISLGGLNEIGKNITAYEYENDIFLVDCGMAFPDDDMLGVDIVLPDFTYLEKNREKIRGVVVTHGHEDHIGGLPYLLKTINMPVYGTRLTLALVDAKLKEHGLSGSVSLNVVVPRQIIKLGCMSVEFIRVNHSIPDAVALAITTPAGVVVQTGDFKVDYTPIEGEIIDLARFGELGNQGVLALLSDSTNAQRPGYTPSERTVGDSFEKLFKKAQNRRIIIATFSSNIHRVQQIVDCAKEFGRKVAVSGRSMENVTQIAQELGYLKIPDGVLIDVDLVSRYQPEQIVLITTGSQGEPMSALTRMANSEHRKIEITSEDFIIISATPIPGNEKLVSRVVNELMKLGAEVIYEKMYEVHVSGHACQEELKMMMALTKPRYFIPVHGEYKHLKVHASLASAMGMDDKHIIISDIGKVIETNGVEMKITGVVPAGRVMVDGLGVGDVGSIVLRDRKRLSEDGLLVVVTTINSATGLVTAGPDIVSRGFVYVRESEALMDEARNVAKDALNACAESNTREWGTIKNRVKDALSTFIYQKTKRSPMILPIIMEV